MLLAQTLMTVGCPHGVRAARVVTEVEDAADQGRPALDRARGVVGPVQMPVDHIAGVQVARAVAVVDGAPRDDRRGLRARADRTAPEDLAGLHRQGEERPGSRRMPVVGQRRHQHLALLAGDDRRGGRQRSELLVPDHLAGLDVDRLGRAVVVEEEHPRVVDHRRELQQRPVVVGPADVQWRFEVGGPVEVTGARLPVAVHRPLEVVDLLGVDLLRRSRGCRRVGELEVRMRHVVRLVVEDHQGRGAGQRDDHDPSRQQPAPQRPTRNEPRHGVPW